jgi:hypothetical protein
VAPDEAALDEHLARADFLYGQEHGRWRLINRSWPFATISVTARDGKQYALRFECTGYPGTPVTACLWDEAGNCKLPAARWPGGGGRVAAVFRVDWNNGECPYLPCDRRAIAGHNDWLTTYRPMLWQPQVGICHYLEQVSELLHSKDYTGARGG